MKTAPWKTQNDLPEAVRVDVALLLNQLLADAIDLSLQAKQAHWNVKGPNFAALHLLFDEVAQGLDESVDELAERVAQLGGIARGTLQVVAQGSRLPAYPLDLAWGCDHVQSLSAALAALGKSVRAAIATADSSGDADTADLFTQVSRSVDKLLWKVEAHQCEA
jgi:starvation-inducible DNA-binding protein